MHGLHAGGVVEGRATRRPLFRFSIPDIAGHLDLYREIQKAGRIVHVQVSKENVEPLLRELDPTLLMLQTHCKDVA